MRKFPENRRIQKWIRFGRSFSQLNIPVYAANAGFFIILAVFPALILMMGLLRYTGLDPENLLEILDRIVPRALMEKADGLIFSIYANTNGAVIGLSAVTALWSASRGVHGLRVGLNAIYAVEENRSYFISRAISLAYTLAFLLVLFLTLVLHVFGNSILQWLQLPDMELIGLLASIIDFRFFLLLIVQTLMFTLMYTAVPSRRNRFRDSVPGALLASIGWLVFSDVFSIYVENFSSYANIYGSVYAIALAMLWLYFCMSILFYGGALNRYLSNENQG